MAVHLPQDQAILKAQLLMLASHNIEPQMPITVPSLRIWFGSILYDQRKIYLPRKENFRSSTFLAEETNIALNEGRLELNARVKIRAKILMMLEN
jgi:DNA-directed RNA polymerase subunit beta'